VVSRQVRGVTSATTSPDGGPWLTHASAQRYARIAGALLAVTVVGGFLGEIYVPGTFLGGDAVAVAGRIAARPSLYRLGFLAYLCEAVADIALAWVMYVLLAPVHRHLALLAAFFGIASMATFAMSELFYYVALVILGSEEFLREFSPRQVESLAALALRVYARGSGIFMVLYGIPAVIRGVLIVRSRYLPSAIGWLWVIAGCGFILRNLAMLVAPPLASDLLLAPMALATLALMGWLLAKGVDETGWKSAVGEA
jgi:hypothetical protein